MKPDNSLNLTIGALGTAISALSPEKMAAIAAGFSTAAWMLYQLGAAIYDRAQRRRDRRRSES